jgi:hypothetical protein
MDWKRGLLVAAVLSLAATAALAILILLFSDFGSTEGRILGTTAAISFFSLLALPGGILLEHRRAQALGVASIALAAGAFVLVLAWIWTSGNSETLARLAGAATAFAAAATQVAGLTARSRDTDPSSVRFAYAGASGLALVLASMTTFAIYEEVDSEGFYRVLAALAVLDVFLVLLQPFLRRLGTAAATTTSVVLEGTAEQIDDALTRLEGTGLEHAQHRDQGLGGAPAAEPDACLRADTQRLEAVGQAVGRRLGLAVGDRRPLEEDRGRGRRALGPGFEQAVEPLAARPAAPLAAGFVPGAEELEALGRGEQRQLVEPALQDGRAHV